MRLSLLALFLFGSVALAEPNKHYVTDVKILDGDTIQANIHLGWDVSLANKHIRCLDYDAWETSKRRKNKVITDEEIKKGFAAKADLQQLLQKAQKVYIEPGPDFYDNYGRVLGRLFVVYPDGRVTEVSQYMKDAGHQRK